MKYSLVLTETGTNGLMQPIAFQQLGGLTCADLRHGSELLWRMILRGEIPVHAPEAEEAKG